MTIKDVNSRNQLYRRIGNNSIKYQLHSILLESLLPDTEYKIVLNVNGKNITELAKSAFSNGSVFKTSPLKTKDLKDDPIEVMVTSNMPSMHQLPDRYYTQTIDAMITGGDAIKDGGEMS